jgi:TRAP-type uncharacterized transport system substrate-binding protein
VKRLVVALALALVLARPAAADSVGVVTDMLAGDAKMGMDLTAVDTPDHRVLWMGGAGSLQNLLDILHTRGVDAGLMLTDTLGYARAHRLASPAELSRIRYIAKLWQEEVHVMAGPSITAIGQLNGKHVNVDVIGSSSWMTANIVFTALDIHPILDTKPQGEALIALRAGKLDALFQVAGAPVALFANLPEDSPVHFLPVLDVAGLDATYAPSALTSAEYPHLVHANDVPTLSIGAMLAVYDWPHGTERYNAVAAFTRDLFANFDLMARPPRHPKWREVNLGASAPGWTRFAVADDMIRARFFHDEAQRLPNLGAHPTKAQMERLWQAYVAWRDAAKGR